MKNLCKVTHEYRIDTIEEVKDFQEKLRKQAQENGTQLTTYSWTEKQITQKGEIVDEYYQVKVVETIDDFKYPDKSFTGIEFKNRMLTAVDLDAESEF